MLKNLTLLSTLLALGLSHALAQTAAPAPAPAWKQGMPTDMADSKLAPHAAKFTATAAADVQLDQLKLPPG